MAHPGIFLAIASGIVVVMAGRLIYDQYFNEYQSYEQFHRNHTRHEKDFNRFHRHYNDFDFDDDYEEEQKVVNSDRGEENNIRKRRPYGSPSNSNDDLRRSTMSERDQDQYELDELEMSIAERKRRLMAEQAFLDQEEENLRIRKNALMNNNFDDVTPVHQARSRSSMSSSNDEDDDEHSLRNHMAVFDPFADQFQDSQDHSVRSLSNSDSTERMVSTQNEEQQSSQEAEEEKKLEDSAELRFPSPHTNSPTTSNTTSVAGDERQVRGISDSEESWDAVSELDDWNQSSTYSSDNEHYSHRSITSDSEDDRLRF